MKTKDGREMNYRDAKGCRDCKHFVFLLALDGDGKEFPGNELYHCQLRDMNEDHAEYGLQNDHGICDLFNKGKLVYRENEQ